MMEDHETPQRGRKYSKIFTKTHLETIPRDLSGKKYIESKKSE